MQPSPFPYRRINVVGTSAAGKTTFARALAGHLDVPCVELDALHWEAAWTEAPEPVMRQRVTDATVGEAWVVDGNYSAVRDIVWGRAQAVVWLDFPLRTVLWRYAARTQRRIRTGEELWPGTGNRERLSMHLLTPRQPAVVDPQHLPAPPTRVSAPAGGQPAAGIGAVSIGSRSRCLAGDGAALGAGAWR